MKKNIITVVIIISIGMFCPKQILNATIIPENTVNETKYKVEKISEEGTAYVIDLSRNDTIYRVLTESKSNPFPHPLKKPEKPKECETELIEVGKFYYLKLDTFFYYPIKNSMAAAGVYYGITFNGSNIYILWETLYSLSGTLYTTKNLKGLCLVKETPFDAAIAPCSSIKKNNRKQKK